MRRMGIMAAMPLLAASAAIARSNDTPTEIRAARLVKLRAQAAAPDAHQHSREKARRLRQMQRITARQEPTS